MEMKKLVLDRIEDETGISGTGIVALGVVFPDGKCTIEWQTKNKSVCVYDSLSDVIAIHGHAGKTRIVVSDFAADRVKSAKALRDLITGLQQDLVEDIDIRGWRAAAEQLIGRLAQLETEQLGAITT